MIKPLITKYKDEWIVMIGKIAYHAGSFAKACQVANNLFIAFRDIENDRTS